jgi:HSP20 family molecular chaperone IbpA
MNGYQWDMVDEMDEMLDHLFARMQEDMFLTDLPVPGYRIVIRNGGYPSPEPVTFKQQPDTTLCVEPEVHRVEDDVMVIAELPGAVPESISLELNGRALIIGADGPGAPYSATADLPPVDPGSMQKTFRNGVLEVTLRLLPEPAVPA